MATPSTTSNRPVSAPKSQASASGLPARPSTRWFGAAIAGFAN